MNNLKYIIKKIIPKIIFDNISLGPKIDPPIQHNRPIRQPFPWNRMNATLKEINPISSMITEDESLYLNWLAKDYYKGIGEIVDAGPYLGGSTYAFASGLEKNIKVAEKFNRIHSYDIFEYMPGSEASLTYPTDKLEAGDSILPFFKQNIKPFKKNVKIYPGNILNFHWDGKSIEVLFIDLSKSWDVNNYIIKEFFGHLIPNHSIVIQQDYFHFMCYWIHITMQFFSNYFKILPSPDGTTLSFKLIKKIPNDLSNINFYSHLSKGELINLLEEAIAPWQGKYKHRLMTTKLFFLAQVCHDYEQAMALSEEMRKSPEWSYWNLWDLSQAETFIPDEMRFPMLEDKSLLTGFSRSYYILKHKNKCYGIPRHIKEFDISNLSGNKNSNFAVSKNLAEMKANIKENILRTNAIIKEMTPE